MGFQSALRKAEAHVMSAEDRARNDSTASALMEKARLHVQVYHPFFGALLSKLKLRSDRRHPTMYTDAVVIGYNPDFVCSLKFEHIVYIQAHEVAHCALRHPFRRGKRNPKLWNTATDHVSNLFLNGDSQLASFRPDSESPAGCGHADARFEGLAAEQVYAILESEQEPEEQDPSQDSQQQDGESDLKGSTGGAGDCLDAGASGEKPEEDEEEEEQDEPKGKGDKDGKTEKKDSDQPAGKSEEEADSESDGDDATGDEEGDGENKEGSGTSSDADESPAEQETEVPVDVEGNESGSNLSPSEVSQLEREWGEATQTAALAAGGDPGEGMGRALGEAGVIRRSFDEYIDEFAQRCLAEDESWKRPNRRFDHAYLPSRSLPRVKTMVAGVDTSASIGERELRLFEQACDRIMEEFGCDLVVLYCDTRIRKVERFQRGEQVAMAPAGGGGTMFDPVFAYTVKLIEEGEDIAGVIYMTDLEGHVSGWRKYEHIETLWVSTQNPNKDTGILGLYGLPPFGRVCSIFD